jgi:hypothetical protein
LHTSFGYFKHDIDNIKVLRNVYSSLKKEGRFLLEQRNVYSEKGRNDINEAFLINGGKVLFSKQSSVNFHEGIWSGAYIYIDVLTKSRQAYPFSIKMYSLNTLLEMLCNVGFSLRDIKIFSDYEGSDFLEDRDASLVLIAQKGS